MDWCQIEYDHYGKKYRKWLVRCETREDLEECYERYGFEEKGKEKAIDGVIDRYGLPAYVVPVSCAIYMSFEYDGFVCRIYRVDPEHHKIVRTAPMNKMCVELV